MTFFGTCPLAEQGERTPLHVSQNVKNIQHALKKTFEKKSVTSPLVLVQVLIKYLQKKGDMSPKKSRCFDTLPLGDFYNYNEYNVPCQKLV